MGPQPRLAAGAFLKVILAVLLALAAVAAGVIIYNAGQAARDRQRAAEQEAQELTASVGGGAALESELLGRAGRNFTLALRDSQSRYDSAWGALTNPPVLDMALIRSRADLRARAEAVRRLLNAAKDLRDFAENTPEIYRQELQRHKLAPSAREAELQKFAGDIAVVNPTIIAMRRTQVRGAEALLRVVLRLEASWGRWEYLPATRELRFQDAQQAEDYNLACQEYGVLSEKARSLQELLRAGKP